MKHKFCILLIICFAMLTVGCTTSAGSWPATTVHPLSATTVHISSGESEHPDYLTGLKVISKYDYFEHLQWYWLDPNNPGDRPLYNLKGIENPIIVPELLDSSFVWSYADILGMNKLHTFYFVPKELHGRPVAETEEKTITVQLDLQSDAFERTISNYSEYTVENGKMYIAHKNTWLLNYNGACFWISFPLTMPITDAQTLESTIVFQAYQIDDKSDSSEGYETPIDDNIFQ